MHSRMALFLTHLIGNALLLLLGYWWLGTNESDASQLAASAVTLLVFLAGAAWLHAVALVCFCGLTFGDAVKRATRNLPPLLVLVLIAALIYAVLYWADGRFAHTAYVIGSSLTMITHRPVNPASVGLMFRGILVILRWVVVPAALFPLAAAVSDHGWSGWHLRFLRRRRLWLYGIEIAVLLLAAIWAPLHLFFWIPAIESFVGQMASFILRATAAYLLFVAGLLAIAFLTSSGSPRETQPSTVVSP